MDKLKALNTNTFRYKPLDGYMREYFQKTHIDYSYMLSGNSVSADLYKVNVELSSVSEGAGASLEPIGKDSPYIFDKIEKIPIYNCTPVDISLGWNEDSGYSAEMRLECIVPPSNLAIEISDYIKLLYSDFQNLWKVTDASPSNFEEIYYTKLTLMPTMYKSEDIEFQVKKRYSYVFESGAVLDKLRNDNLNEILDKFNLYYKDFISYYYSKQQLIMDKDTLKNMPSKYFKMLDVPAHILVANYFFKRYLSNSIITYSIDHKYPINKTLKCMTDEEAYEMIDKDEYKILYNFIRELEKSAKPSDALNNSINNFDYIRLTKLKDEPIDAFEKFENPYVNKLNFDKDYYKMVYDTLVMLENEDNPEVITNDIKLLSNLKKLISSANKSLFNESDVKHNLLKALFLLFIFKGISFKNINYTTKELEYGE